MIKTHNYEALGVLAFAEYLNLNGKISITKSLLILPFILHKPSLRILSNQRINSRSLEEIIVKNPEIMSGFNDRYQNYLTTYVNVISMLFEMNLIKLTKTEIELTDKVSIQKWLSLRSKMGKKGQKFENASSSLISLFDREDLELYAKLQIQL